MPSDHVIVDLDAFHSAIDAALPFADDGWLVTFGIAPDAPQTGYGYIETGEAIGEGVHRVARFVEKPDRETAEAMLTAGGHAWNGGIFMFRADIFLGTLAVHAPDMLTATQTEMREGQRIGTRIHPAVSYTHLDVYKRQTQPSSAAASNSAKSSRPSKSTACGI